MLTEESLHRKIARLRESVMAVLQTLLAKRHGRAPGKGSPFVRSTRRAVPANGRSPFSSMAGSGMP